MFNQRSVFVLIANLVFLAVFAGDVAAQRGRTGSDLGKSFRDYTIARLDSSSLYASGDVRLVSPRMNFDLSMAPRDLRARRYRSFVTDETGLRLVPRASAATYAGVVKGDSGSSVRFTMREGSAEGYFYTGGTRYLVEPASRYSKTALPGEMVVYKPGDHIDEQGYVCLSGFEERLEKGGKLTSTRIARLLDGPGVVEIATDADLEYVNDLGSVSAANAEILGILNMVEGTFQQELDLSISVVFQHAWTTADNYNGSSGSTLLSSFKAYWNANFPASTFPRDTAHLFSSKPAVLSMGVAYVGTVCRSPLSAYGFSGRITWAPGKYLVTAHELGHNLAANHVDATQGCENTLMNAVLSGSTPMSFCEYSRNEMNTFVQTYGDCLAPPPSPYVAEFDFDGDTRSDLSVFRPQTGAWYVLNSSDSSVSTVQFGALGDQPAVGDYDGDGFADPAVFRNGAWYTYNSADNTFTGIGFGLSSDVPVPGDYDGDGITDRAVFRPFTGKWYIRQSSDFTVREIQFGIEGDIPRPGDYNGDGIADFNVWRPSNGGWYLLDSTGLFTLRLFGTQGDRPVRGDFDGDGKADLAFFRPSTGAWAVIRSSNNTSYEVSLGQAGDVPLTADFDGDQKTDMAVFRPVDAVWLRKLSSNGQTVLTKFGGYYDVPAPAPVMP